MTNPTMNVFFTFLRMNPVSHRVEKNHYYVLTGWVSCDNVVHWAVQRCYITNKNMQTYEQQISTQQRNDHPILLPARYLGIPIRGSYILPLTNDKSSSP